MELVFSTRNHRPTTPTHPHITSEERQDQCLVGECLIGRLTPSPEYRDYRLITASNLMIVPGSFVPPAQNNIESPGEKGLGPYCRALSLAESCLFIIFHNQRQRKHAALTQPRTYRPIELLSTRIEAANELRC